MKSVPVSFLVPVGLFAFGSTQHVAHGLSSSSPPDNVGGRRSVLTRSLPAAAATAFWSAIATTTDDRSAAFAAVDVRSEIAPPKQKFQRYPQIRFIAALGDPRASSGTGAETWGLWRDDPGPRGVYLRDLERRVVAKAGKAPAGWTLDPDAVWIEEHGLVMPAPGDLPRTSYDARTGAVLDRKTYVVTGDREVTTALTVYDDGRWELAKGDLYDVTHLPCRSAKYTPASGRPSGSCVPTAEDQQRFPVRPGAAMPPLRSEGCDQRDYAVLFVLGEETFR